MIGLGSEKNNTASFFIVLAGAVTEWQEWRPWSQCTVSCGKGVEFRARSCNEPAVEGIERCPGNYSETRECSSIDCPGQCSGSLHFRNLVDINSSSISGLVKEECLL